MRFARLARELGAYITVPFIECDDAQYFNSVSLVAPEGNLVAHYRKNCPWPVPEKSWATPGSGIEEASCDTPYGRVGLAICFDIHTILSKYASGPDLWALLYPIGWVGDTAEWFGKLLPQRLFECNCPHYVLVANW